MMALLFCDLQSQPVVNARRSRHLEQQLTGIFQLVEVVADDLLDAAALEVRQDVAHADLPAVR